MQFHPEAAGGPFDTAFLFEAFVRHVRGAAPQLTLLDPAIYRNDRASLKRVLLVGSGGLSIGQAGEFDYSGVQQCLTPSTRLVAISRGRGWSRFRV